MHKVARPPPTRNERKCLGACIYDLHVREGSKKADKVMFDEFQSNQEIGVLTSLETDCLSIKQGGKPT